jgi:hypothetical protein
LGFNNKFETKYRRLGLRVALAEVETKVEVLVELRGLLGEALKIGLSRGTRLNDLNKYVLANIN